MPRNMLRDTEDTAAFLVNAIAEELERILRSVRQQELKLTAAIEEFSQAFTRVASGDFSVQVKRDFSGDSNDVLAFMVNQTVLELGSLVNARQRQADEERDRLEHLIHERTTELRLLATKDPLTGLLNRRHFFQLAEDECARCRRYGRPITVVMLDLDHFKKVNDNHGHAIGDEALRLTAAAMRKELRQQDLICRYGGEEFVVLMPETDAQRGYEVQERIRAGIAQIDLRDGDQVVPLRVSIGVTQWHPPESISHAIERADANMYQAKSAGRNRVIMTP
jgi:diguanylate cyclase (GGDEF)-like protein